MIIRPSCTHTKDFCPICFRKQVFMSYKKKQFKDYVFGSTPTPFIGRFNYPNINVGVLNLDSHKEDASIYDSPKEWARKNFSIEQVANLRVDLINSRSKSNVKGSEKINELSRLVGLAKRPVDMEVQFKKKPSHGFNFDNYSSPSGPKALISRASITENVPIDSRVEKVHSDTDLKANDALTYLQSRGFNETFLSRALSVGAFGKKLSRKLVPTRWSITASDDILGKNLIGKIKDFKESSFLSFFDGYLGNNYLVLFLPGVWSFELFEIMVSKSVNPWSKNKLFYSTDYEFYNGRKSYADETIGGYYASRLGIAEKLFSMKRQASVLVFRFITDNYSMPLGVWVVREACRKSLNSEGFEFSDHELLLNYARTLSKKKFNIDLDVILSKSKVLKETKSQKKLFEF